MTFYEIRVKVHLSDQNGAPLLDAEGAPVSYEVTHMRQKDELKALVGDGQARVSVSLSEKMSGPYGYSSINVSVTVTMNCDQSVEYVRKAEEAALQECLGFLDTAVDTGYASLTSHLARYIKD